MCIRDRHTYEEIGPTFIDSNEKFITLFVRVFTKKMPRDPTFTNAAKDWKIVMLLASLTLRCLHQLSKLFRFSALRHHNYSDATSAADSCKSVKDVRFTNV